MTTVTAYRTDYGELFSNENDALIAEKNHAYGIEAEALAEREGVYADGKKAILAFLMENKSSIKHLGSLV